MACPKISYFSTDALTLVWIILIIVNLVLVIYAAMTTETFVSSDHNSLFETFSI